MVQSINRAMQIVATLHSNPQKKEWPLSELAEQLALPASTIHRLLQSLLKHGLVAQNSVTKHYSIGYKWMEIGLQALDAIDFRNVARPVLESLAAEAEENVYVNIVSGSDGMIIEKIESPLKIRVAEDLGLRMPLWVGAPNKVLLAHMPVQEQKNILGEQRTLIEQLRVIREQGYAISVSEKTENTASVAAPVFDFTHRAIVAISVGVPGFRFTPERKPVLIELVKNAAKRISMLLGNA
ncbi:IclR family transcriptional regulator [Ectobacillus antri]|jgi:DNA-binding IclR family transcriptional regulator|uniref:IclR family transcriptional regulator n=1 Tax=Ectobacillus antri TaxID=2486280 RepID=A0ABT6H552_9BACI|nr:IclR family transcriptional regulator [Ectobacillus antri]MDG4658398.1 IclR family transcriptional regulator [Ectobacillus antri]MDG5753732.1 IclR family transcriptional regulator [Ectobacillus antri]